MNDRRLFLFVCCVVACTFGITRAQTFDPGVNPSFAAAVLVETETGTVLFEYNGDVPRSPASTQKLLLKLVVMDLIETGKFTLEDSVRVSAHASRIGGSQVFQLFPLGNGHAVVSSRHSLAGRFWVVSPLSFCARQELRNRCLISILMFWFGGRIPFERRSRPPEAPTRSS